MHKKRAFFFETHVFKRETYDNELVFVKDSLDFLGVAGL